MTENKPFMKEAEKNSSMVEMVIKIFKYAQRRD